MAVALVDGGSRYCSRYSQQPRYHQANCTAVQPNPAVGASTPRATRPSVLTRTCPPPQCPRCCITCVARRPSRSGAAFWPIHLAAATPSGTTRGQALRGPDTSPSMSLPPSRARPGSCWSSREQISLGRRLTGTRAGPATWTLSCQAASCHLRTIPASWRLLRRMGSKSRRSWAPALARSQGACMRRAIHRKRWRFYCPRTRLTNCFGWPGHGRAASCR
mmetsp:Transcript_27525/g.70754  ORF Transcript_27525/g.70754 Transcript_27525/m.70754 type:complete len:219 (-) Transcript_27525:595-1251(-)